MKRNKIILSTAACAVFAVASLLTPLAAQSNDGASNAATEAKPAPAPKKKFEPSIKVNGFAFMDLYYVAQASTNLTNASPVLTSAGFRSVIKQSDFARLVNFSDLPSSENRFGFQARRLVLGIDGYLAENFKTRVSIIAQQAYFTTNNIVSSIADNGTLTVFEAYAWWDYITSGFGNQSFVFGIQNNPAWKLSERVWGYRSVEKTATDLFGFRKAKDFGVSLKGKLFSGVLNYDFMVGNNNGTGETAFISNDLLPKTFYGSVGASIPLGTTTDAKGAVVTNELALDAYMDANLVNDAAKALWTAQGSVGFVSPVLRIGANYSVQTTGTTITNATPSGTTNSGLFATTVLSFPISFSLSEALKIKDVGLGIYGRFDLRDIQPYNFQNYYVVAGLDISPLKYLSFLPNVEMFFYNYPGVGTDHVSDIVPRLTVRFSF